MLPPRSRCGDSSKILGGGSNISCESRFSKTGKRFDRSLWLGNGQAGETGRIPKWKPVSSWFISGVCRGVRSAGNSRTPSTAERGISSLDCEVLGGLTKLWGLVSFTVAIELKRLCLENLDSRLDRDRESEWRNDRAFSMKGNDESDPFFRNRLSREVN